MRRIEHHKPSAEPHPLPTPRPIDLHQPARDQLVRQNCAHLRLPRRQLPRGQSRRRRVPALVISLQIRCRILREILPELLGDTYDPRPALGRPRPDYALHRRDHPAHHDRHPRLDDSSLLGGDQLDRVAQHFTVIEPDRCDHTHRRRHDIRGVEPSAKADLDYIHIALFPGELQKRHRRHELEKTRMVVRAALRRQPRRHRPQLLRISHDFALTQQHPIHLHAFAQPHQMRRGVEPAPQSRLFQDRVEHRRHRALAVGPRNVHAGHRALRVPDRRREQPHPVDAKLQALRLQAEEIVLHRRVIGEFRFVTHGSNRNHCARPSAADSLSSSPRPSPAASSCGAPRADRATVPASPSAGQSGRSGRA